MRRNVRTDIFHYGTPRRSGRYPWGSGKAGYQRQKNLLADISKLIRLLQIGSGALFSGTSIAVIWCAIPHCR